MPNHALERGQEPFAEIDHIKDVGRSYLDQTDGNPSAALRLAACDVLVLNDLPPLIAEGVNWGFLRRAKAELVASKPG
jgi:hypothetical protein